MEEGDLPPAGSQEVVTHHLQWAGGRGVWVYLCMCGGVKPGDCLKSQVLSRCLCCRQFDNPQMSNHCQ